VLPSPNGATLTLATGETPTLAGCLRNARAVANAARHIGKRIAVIPAGERWQDGSLRFALEDWLGAGAILDALAGNFSPEARAAQKSFRAFQSELARVLQACDSGQELIAKNLARDVELASAYDVSEVVPMLREGAYRAL
jgi:2-phosphosulfolactate phosphatase